MIWSKLKKNIENNFSESLGDRVNLYTTTYGSNYDVQDLYNRGWITVDGITGQEAWQATISCVG